MSNTGDPNTNDGCRDDAAGEEPRRDDPSRSAFDPETLRMRQDFGAQLGVKKQILSISVRKPDRHWWIRVHPDPKFRLEPAAILERKEEREMYIVAPELVSELGNEIKPKTLFTAVNTRGVPFVWPVSLPREGGALDAWSASAFEAAAFAMTRWVRVASNMSAGFYEAHKTDAELPEPEWPDLKFRGILEIAFRGRIISDLDHPVLRELFRGHA